MNIYTPMEHIYAQQTENHEKRQAIACRCVSAGRASVGEAALSNLKTIATHCRMLAVIAALYLSLGSASAQTLYSGFTRLSEGIPGCYTNTGEFSDKLVDGITDVAGNKWCVVNGNPDAGTWSATIFTEFKSDAAFIPSSYIMTTGGDTYNYSGRNPTSWKIFGKLNQCDDWTELVSVTNNTSLPIANNESREFSLTNTTTPCRYFRFEVSNIRSGTVFQLAELQFKGTDYSAPPEVTPTELTMSDGLSQEIECGTCYFFYDDGGPNGNYYSHSATQTATFTSDGEITIEFISLEAEGGSYDYMNVYDETADNEHDLFDGNLNTTPNSTQTATSGTMIIKWKTDSSVEKAGWVAKISAVNCCSLDPTLACTDGDLLLGSTRTLSVTGGNGSVTWTASPAGIVSFSSTNGRSTTVTATSPGEVTVTAMVAGSGNYCPAVLTCNINVPLPTPTITQANNPLPQCETEDAVLTASVDGSMPAGYTFHWYSNSACTTEITSGVSGTNNNILSYPASNGAQVWCRLEKPGGSQVTDIAYSENIYEYSVPNGTSSLTLEVWGAQGGSYNDTWVGGKGGYSKGTWTNPTASTLYVVVGGQPTAYTTTPTGTTNTTINGGYNGGGSAVVHYWSSNWSLPQGGGGATHIATATGILSALASQQDNVLIVAGGGSGGGCYNNGSTSGYVGYAGGGTESDGYTGGTNTYKANQTTPGYNGSFGQGASSTGGYNFKYGPSGGGGGWYGGGSNSYSDTYSVEQVHGHGGGSGYIKSSLTNTSSSNGSQSGNGKAKITAFIPDSYGPAEGFIINCCGLNATIQFGD